MGYKLVRTMNKIKLGKYKEYTGRFADVIMIAKEADSKEDFVIYKYSDDPEGNIIATPLSIYEGFVQSSGIKKFTHID